MKHYAGIDVSLETSSVCVVDAEGRIIGESKVASEPEALVGWFSGLETPLERIGLEAGPLSQWLHEGMTRAGLAVELLETRHVRNAFKTMPVKTDKKELSIKMPLVVTFTDHFSRKIRKLPTFLSPLHLR